MFRIHQVHDANTAEDKANLSAVIRIYEEAFSYYPQYAAKIADFLKFYSSHDFDIILLVAEGDKKRVMGFALTFYFPKLKYAYLDYLASDPKRLKRGYGGALYERTCEILTERGCKGLLMDVPPDDPKKLDDVSRLKINQKRMAFYEQLGARPIVGMLYDAISHKANQGYLTYLLYAPLTQKSLTASSLKKVVTKILLIKGNMAATDEKTKKIINSIKDTPVKIRDPRYQQQESNVSKAKKSQLNLTCVSTGDANQIHHLKERGYVERPARVNFISKGIEELKVEYIKLKHYGEKYITDVHLPALVKFLKKAESELEIGKLVYPNVFPIRKGHLIPKNWEMQAGYYCIDTFTPVTHNAYKAARSAVDAALTGAEYVLNKQNHIYVLCRPPGHHAESRVFGGFCYFNNAAIAANYLSKHGKVAFLDIDYHHGNGSQEIFYSRNDVYFISIHGHPRVAYPYFSGYSDERGDGIGKGFNKNYPLYPGTNDEQYLAALTKAIHRLKSFKADYLVLSLGFDIMAGDPTGSFAVTPNGMRHIGKTISSLNLPTLVVQEGGYALRNLRLGSLSFFQGLLEK